MFFNDSFREPGRDILYTADVDLRIIRRDIIAVLQETADIRATMDDISSLRRGASKRFIVLAGLICFILLASLAVFQEQLQVWLKLM